MALLKVDTEQNSETKRQVYINFHCYDFQNDKTFQDGLQQIKEQDDFTEMDLLKSKLFYYSKYVFREYSLLLNYLPWSVKSKINIRLIPQIMFPVLGCTVRNKRDQH